MAKSNHGWLLRALLTCAVAVLATTGGQALATPLPSLPLGPVPVAGETELTSFIFPAASDITIDWMVTPYTGGLAGPAGPVPAGGYLYLYQIENTSAVASNAFTISLPAGTTAGVIAAGRIAGDDLDVASAFHPAHASTIAPADDAVPGPFAGLFGEEGPFALVGLGALSTSIDVPGNNISWTFTPLIANRESETLFFIHPNPPTYGLAVAQDSTPPSPWGSLAVGGEPVPVPVPEPQSIFLAAVGLAALVSLARRRPCA